MSSHSRFYSIAICQQAALCAGLMYGAGIGAGMAADPAAKPAAGGEGVQPAAEPAMYIREYRVLGAKTLPSLQVEEAVYPFLGPGRTFADVDQARSALEKAYHA